MLDGDIDVQWIHYWISCDYQPFYQIYMVLHAMWSCWRQGVDKSEEINNTSLHDDFRADIFLFEEVLADSFLYLYSIFVGLFRSYIQH